MQLYTSLELSPVKKIVIGSTTAFIIYWGLEKFIRARRVGRYDERYILVTGCDTGFGHEIAKRLDKLGCHVFAACLTEKGETELQKTTSNRLKAVSMDVTDTESVRRALTEVENFLPTGKGELFYLNIIHN